MNRGEIRYVEKYLLAIAPAVAYFLAYSYELGYCSVWKIPAFLIKLDLSNILFCAVAAFGIMYLIIPLIRSFQVYQKIDKEDSVLRRSAKLYSSWLVLLLIVGSLTIGNWRFYKVYFILFALFLMMDVLNALVHVKKSPFFQNIKGPFNVLLQPGSMWDAAKVMTGPYFPLLVALFISQFLSFLLGQIEARNQTHFLVSNSNPNSLVLRVYGENAICGTYDPSTKRPTTAYFLIDLSKADGVVVNNTEIGRLNFE